MHFSNHTEQYLKVPLLFYGQKIDCPSTQYILTELYRVVTKDSPLAPAQTTSKVNFILHSHCLYLVLISW
jgi:hypothetical protein